MLTKKFSSFYRGGKERRISEQSEQHIVKLLNQSSQFFICWGAACSNTCRVVFVRFSNSPVPKFFWCFDKLRKFNKVMKNYSSKLIKSNPHLPNCTYEAIKFKIEDTICGLESLLHEIQAFKPAKTKEQIIDKLDILLHDITDCGFGSEFYNNLVASITSSIKELRDGVC